MEKKAMELLNFLREKFKLYRVKLELRGKRFLLCSQIILVAMSKIQPKMKGYIMQGSGRNWF